MSAAALHLAGGRADAAWIVPVALVWGILALAGARGSFSLGMVVALAVAVRFPLVGTPPLLSDDLYRYLWEGLVLNSGQNPFATAPQQIHGLDDALRDRVNHGDITSIYPPVALGWFRLLAVVGRSAIVVQAATALVDVGNVVLLHRILTGRGRATWPAALYALHPLAALEFAGSGHVDALAISLALAAVLLHDRGHRLGLAALTLAGGTKLLPLLWSRRWLEDRRQWVGGLVAALVVVLLAAPVLGPGALTGLRTYHAHWQFNPLLYPLIDPILGAHTRSALLGLGGVAVLGASRLRDPVEAWWVVATAFLMLSPTVHPWYTAWALVPSLILGRRAWAVGCVAFVGSYAVLASWDPNSGSWHEPAWLPLVTWGPTLLAHGLEHHQGIADGEQREER